MKATKKIMAAALILTAATAFAAPSKTSKSTSKSTSKPAQTVTGTRGQKGPDFTNVIYSDIVTLSSTTTGSGDTKQTTTDKDFAGIYDQTSVELLSGAVDAGIKVTASASKNKNITGAGWSFSNGFYTTTEDVYGLFGFELNDWYIEWRPVDMVTLGLHDYIYTAGSYLPLADKNMKEGNFGSDFTVVFRPIAGLRAAAGVDYPSYFGSSSYNPVFNVGIDYTYGTQASAGVIFRNIMNEKDRSMGFYGTFTGVADLSVALGFSVNDAGSVSGIDGNVLNFAASYNYKALTGTFEAVSNFGDADEGDFDTYLGVKAGYYFGKGLQAYLKGAFEFDTDNDKDGTKGATQYTVQPGVVYNYKANEFGASVKFVIKGNTTKTSFPVYWKYSI